MNKKISGQELAATASKIMKSNNSSQIQKSLAGSVLSQRCSNKMTGKSMETRASMVMQSDKYSRMTKSLAASVLSQSDKRR